MAKKEKLVPSGAPIRKGSALLERLRANHDNVDTAASAMERVSYVDVWNPTHDLPSIAQEYLVGGRGWLSGRICQERALASAGKSSFMYLQNVYSPKFPGEQGLSLALALSDLSGAVCRAHGGGFAGTILAFVKLSDLPAYTEYMEAVFGKNAVKPLFLRPVGAVRL